MKDKNARNGLIVISTAAFLVPFMGSSLNLALPEISETLSMKAVTLTWMATVYLISTAIFQIPFARLADLVGRKKIFLTGVVIFSLCSCLCGLSSSSTMLIALRFCAGIGSSMMMGTNIAILTTLFPPENRGRALGINTAVVYASMAVGPLFGGMMTHYFGWQSVFFITASVGVLVLIFAHLLLKGEWITSRGEKFDLIGGILYGISLAAVIYGFSSLPSVAGFACLVGGIICFAYFIYFEKQHKYPVFDVRLFSGNKVFALSSVAALINYAATAGIAFMLSLYLQYVRDLDARHAGLILICQACVQSVFSLIAGATSNRFVPSKMATTGMAIIVVGIAGLVFLNPTTPYWFIIMIMVLLGIGFGIFSAPNTNVIMGSIDEKHYTQASATTGTMRLTGSAFSLGIVGMSISFYLGNEKIIPELYPAFLDSMRMVFIVFFVLCLVGVYASTARIERKRSAL